MGRLDEAEEWLEWYEALADGTGRITARAAALRCRGLLSVARGRPADGIATLEASLALAVTSVDPLGAGRTSLVLGAALRRVHHLREARTALEDARARFSAQGARSWAEACDRELRRIGGRRASGLGLTPTQHQVAEMVAEGRSNREVAAALFVTERTI